jgi:hypothetical protein
VESNTKTTQHKAAATEFKIFSTTYITPMKMMYCNTDVGSIKLHELFNVYSSMQNRKLRTGDYNLL